MVLKIRAVLIITMILFPTPCVVWHMGSVSDDHAGNADHDDLGGGDHVDQGGVDHNNDSLS